MAGTYCMTEPDQINYQDKTDAELVQLSLGSQYHYAAIIERYEPKLLRYIKRSSNVSAEEAEDILQEAFIKAYYNLNGFDKDQKFSSWIYRIVHNEVISAYRKRKARPQGNAVQVDDADIQAIADQFDLLIEVDQHLLQDSMRRALDRLDIKYREVLVLKFLQEKSYDEIAAIIKKPPGTVATRINRAKQQLKKILDSNIAQSVWLLLPN